MAAIRPKVAYYAIQNLAAIYDNNMVIHPEFEYTSTNKESLSVYGYQHQLTKTSLVALWLDGENVTNSFETTQVNITFENISFKVPVWVDLMTGSIHEIPESKWNKSGRNYIFNIPLYDSPVLITDKSFLIK